MDQERHSQQRDPSHAHDANPTVDSSKCVIGLSGGAASAVTAALLKSQNRDLQAVWINLGGVSAEDPADPLSSGLATRCFDPTGRERSRKIASLLGIDWQEIDARDPAWREIIDPYVHSRMDQKIHHPCVACLSQLRIPLLTEWARRHGVGRVVLGVRARLSLDRDTGLIEIRRAGDRARDQSWRLSGLGRNLADLSMLELPLGELPQSMVDRLLAILSDKLGEPVSMDPHSVELGSVACGSSMETVLRVLSRRVATSIRTPGVLRAPTGGILGEHAGMPTWVLGQPIPLEAQNLTLEAVTNAVVGAADGRAHVLMASSQNDWTAREWITDEAIWLVPFQGAEPTAVRLRFPRVPYMDETLVQAMGGPEGDGVPAHWVRLVEGRGHFRLASPQGAASGPGWRGYRMVHGQPVVVYDESGEKLLGTARIFRKVQEP